MGGRTFVILIFLLLGFPLCAREKLLDSLRRDIAGDNPKKAVMSLNHFAWLYNETIPDSALYYSQKALELAERINYPRGIARSYLGIAVAYTVKGQFPQALEYNLKSLRIKEDLGDSLGVSSLYNNIALLYEDMEDYPMAEQYHLRAMAIRKALRGNPEIGSTHVNLAGLYYKMNEDKKAEEHSKLGYEVYSQAKDDYGIALAYNLMAQLHSRRQNYSEALEYHEKALALQKEFDLLNEEGQTYISMGSIYTKMNEPAKAIGLLKKGIGLLEKVKNLKSLAEAYYTISAAYEKAGNLNEAFDFGMKYAILRDSLLSTGVNRRIAEMQAIYETTAKEKEIASLIKDKEIQSLSMAHKDADIKRQRLMLGGIGLVLVVVCALAFIAYRNGRERQKANIELAGQTQTIEQKNKDITDSIRYAEKIQLAMHPSHRTLQAAIPESFVLYKPKDIVSGDFYWFAQKGKYVFVAAADCTGHGVPGALMSMVGLSFLNRLVNEKGMTETAAILDELHRSVITALNKEGGSASRDGMDIALLRIDTENRKAQFSGALRPLCFVDNEGAKIIKGDKFSIGGAKEADQRSFASIEIALGNISAFYLFSDGYADQFGGPNGKKFMMKNFQMLLQSVHQLPAEKQKEVIDQRIEEWKSGNEQVDDILVIGLKV